MKVVNNDYNGHRRLMELINRTRFPNNFRPTSCVAVDIGNCGRVASYCPQLITNKSQCLWALSLRDEVWDEVCKERNEERLTRPTQGGK